MKTKFFVIAVFAFFARAIELRGCSCETLYFCEQLNHDSVKLAFKAIVVMQKDYGGNNFAAYLHIIHKYKAEIAVTDTIKFYGQWFEAGCDIDVRNLGLPGDTILFSLGIYGNSPPNIFNPDSLQENFSEFRPNGCTTVRLNIKSGVVQGWIAEGVFSYPLGLFESGLEDCNFPQEEEPEYRCLSSENIQVFPNPSTSGRIILQSSHKYDSVHQVRIFSVDGRLIGAFSNLIGNPSNPIEIELANSGLYLLEIVCDNRRHYLKIVVNK